MSDEPHYFDPWATPWCTFFFVLVVLAIAFGLSYALGQVVLVDVEGAEITPVELDYIAALPLVTVAFFIGFSLGTIVGRRSKKEKEEASEG